jgi:hypothetical protein
LGGLAKRVILVIWACTNFLLRAIKLFLRIIISAVKILIGFFIAICVLLLLCQCSDLRHYSSNARVEYLAILEQVHTFYLTSPTLNRVVRSTCYIGTGLLSSKLLSQIKMISIPTIVVSSSNEPEPALNPFRLLSTDEDNDLIEELSSQLDAVIAECDECIQLLEEQSEKVNELNRR